MYSARVLAFVAVLVCLVHSFSWDIVVGGNKRLEFFYNGTVSHIEDIPSAHYISSVTYDPVRFKVLFADYHNQKLSIFSFDLTTRKMQTLVVRQTRADYYKNLAYDPVTELLFWIEDKKIYSLSLKPAWGNIEVNGNLLVSLDNYCQAIAVDSCGGFIFWTTNRNIERAALDGSERKVLIEGQVYERRGLVIDQESQKMYWIEEPTAQQLYIKSADLNGENSRAFYFIGKDYWATSLTVSKDFIYWKSHDQAAILQLPKNENHGTGQIAYSVYRGDWWCQLAAANYTIEKQILGNKSCEALKSLIPNVEESSGSTCHNYCFQGNCSISAEGHPKCSCEAGYSGERCEVNACYMYCLNNGVCSVDEAGKTVCQCTAEYHGDRCDVSICKDYCMQGNCSISTDGQPTCRCDAGYSGERCEVNACHEHCLNNGDCSLNEEDEPFCQCTADYDGERCEVSIYRENCVGAEGQPNSRCNASYSGDRCEVNPCRGYCLNNGVCSLHEGAEPVCQCSADYGGDRCEFPTVLIKCIQTVSMLREMLSADVTPVTLSNGVIPIPTCASTVD